jgi:hypothetical protein
LKAERPGSWRHAAAGGRLTPSDDHLIMFTGIATLACLSRRTTTPGGIHGQEMRTRAWMPDDRFTFTVHGAFF